MKPNKIITITAQAKVKEKSQLAQRAMKAPIWKAAAENAKLLVSETQTWWEEGVDNSFNSLVESQNISTVKERTSKFISKIPPFVDEATPVQSA